MKRLVRLVFVLILFLIAAAVVAFFYVDSLARAGIERGGTYALGVPTTLERADVGIFSGTFAMNGLTVANPQGFSADHFLRLGAGDVAVTLPTLRQDLVELPALRLSGLDVVLERRGEQKNYEVILDNLKRLESGEKPAEEAGSKRFVIRQVEIRDVQVHVDLLPVGGDATKLTVPIDVIRLSDVGSGSGGGVLLSDLAGVIIKAVFTAVIENGGTLPVDLRGSLQDGLGRLRSLQDMGISSTAELQKRVEEAIPGELGKEVGEAIKGLGDILGGEKKKK